MLAPNIYIKNVTLAYDKMIVFSHLTAHFAAGKWTSLLGQSGIGKSSLLRLIAGLTTSAETCEGVIETDNHLPICQQVAYMAQVDLLLPWLTVLDNAVLGATLRREKDRVLQRVKAKKLLAQVGLSNVIHFYPHQSSGGMRQRVSLVRTLMEDKPIILMDEPFSALDATTRYHLQTLAAELLKNKTVLFITHDPNEALRLADSIYVMHKPLRVTLTLITHLYSPGPRELNHPDITHWQPVLFKALANAQGVT